MSELQENLEAIYSEKETYLIPENIKSGVIILNVEGEYTGEAPTLQNKSVSISSNGQSTVSADSNYDGLGTVTINASVQPTLQSKSVTITTNGTQTIGPDTGNDGLSQVSITTNVSGGSTTIDTITNINATINTMLNNFNTYAANIPNSYTPASSESVTLYTPNINYPYYIIQKRSSGNYRVVWTNSPRKIDGTNIYPFKTTTHENSRSDIFSKAIEYWIDDVEKDYVYVSSEYSSIQTCIDGMKNNSLTYSQLNNYLAYYPEGNEKVPYANVAVYYFIEGSQGPLNDRFLMPQKISSNETIVQIP